MAFDRVAGTVTEDTDPGIQPADILFVCRIASRFHIGLPRRPGFSVDQLLPFSKFLIQSPLDPVHQIRIQQPHQVEPETVHMVFFRPVQHGFQNILSAHGPFTGNIISAVRAVAPGAVLLFPVIISRHRPFQPGILLIRMIIDHIHDHTKTIPVEMLDHFLELPDPHFPMVWI